MAKSNIQMNKIFSHTFGHFSKKYAVLTSEKVVHYFRAIFPGNFCRQAPNDLCDLYATFRLLFRSNIQISKGSFQSFLFTLPVFLGYRGRVVTGHRILQQSSKKKQAFRLLLLSLWKRILDYCVNSHGFFATDGSSYFKGSIL